MHFPPIPAPEVVVEKPQTIEMEAHDYRSAARQALQI